MDLTASLCRKTLLVSLLSRWKASVKLLRLFLRFGSLESVDLELGGLEVAGLEYGGPVFADCSGCLTEGFVVRPIILLTRDAAEF